MIKRTILYWTLSFIALIICSMVSFSSGPQLQLAPLKLSSFFKIDPNYFYYTNNQFNATVTGQLRLDIKFKTTPLNLTQYNALILEGFQYTESTNASLNWNIKNQKHRTKINKTFNSINSHDFKTTNPNDIQDLHLLIETYSEVGHKTKFQDTVSFKNIYLEDINERTTLAVNLSEWQDFTPIKFNSINAYTNINDLKFKTLVARLVVWLTICLGLFFIFRVGSKHLIITIMVAWSIPVYFYLHNHMAQHQQLQAGFQQNSTGLNRLDLDVMRSAQTIELIISNHPELSQTDTKFVLLGRNDFYNLRLVSHLSQMNIAIRSGIQKILDSNTVVQPVFILAQNYLRYCEQPDKYPWFKSQVDFLHVEDTFCLVREK